MHIVILIMFLYLLDRIEREGGESAGFRFVAYIRETVILAASFKLIQNASTVVGRGARLIRSTEYCDVQNRQRGSVSTCKS